MHKMKIISLCVLTILSTFSLQGQITESLFDFKADIRLFTAYAFMNAAGNDGEWRKAGMHPIRVAVRKDLEGRLDSVFEKQIRNYGSSHGGGSWTGYGPFALITSGPPEFQVFYDSATSDPDCRSIQEYYVDFSPLLAEFYKKANVAALWDKYRPLIQAQNDLRKPFAQKALDDIISYCRLNRNFFTKSANRIHFQFAPLLSYFTAQTARVNGDIYIIAGPQEGEPSEAEFYHESLHHVVNPLVDALDSTTTARFADLFRLADSTSQAGYAQFYEGFVRTLDKVISGRCFAESDSTVAANVTREYKLGFILCRAIYDQLKQYEASRTSFAEYFPKIVANIDVVRERERWLELMKNSK
jgi:hypothetical protein